MSPQSAQLGKFGTLRQHTTGVADQPSHPVRGIGKTVQYCPAGLAKRPSSGPLNLSSRCRKRGIRLTMFIAMSRFTVTAGMETAVERAFHNRPHLVDAAPGFIRMQVLRPTENPREFALITEWQDADAYHRWYRGHAYKDSHILLPEGLRLEPNSTRIETFEQLCS